jgi:hypothetical protein
LICQSKLSDKSEILATIVGSAVDYQSGLEFIYSFECGRKIVSDNGLITPGCKQITEE